MESQRNRSAFHRVLLHIEQLYSIHLTLIFSVRRLFVWIDLLTVVCLPLYVSLSLSLPFVSLPLCRYSASAHRVDAIVATITLYRPAKSLVLSAELVHRMCTHENLTVFTSAWPVHWCRSTFCATTASLLHIGPHIQLSFVVYFVCLCFAYTTVAAANVYLTRINK